MHGRAGFSLIEVLAAIAVLGLGAASAVGLINTASSRLLHARTVQEAGVVAQYHLTQTMLSVATGDIPASDTLRVEHSSSEYHVLVHVTGVVNYPEMRRILVAAQNGRIERAFETIVIAPSGNR